MEVRIDSVNLFELAKRLNAEFVAIVSANTAIIDKYHRSICDLSGNLSIENTDESVSGVVGTPVLYITGSGYTNSNRNEIEVYLAESLANLSALQDASRYIGTGGGPQAYCWAQNKRSLIRDLNKYLPPVNRFKKFEVWSGKDFGDMIELSV